METKVKPLAKLLSGVGGSKGGPVVPPVLHEVGKLAASVASVSTLQIQTGSATGNPRNKCALKPGHSLMDWIRLTNSGKDLTHVGALAGKLKVTYKDLQQHNREDDVWISIKGNVYNITEYLHFHPGGVEQIMQGAGQDSSDLFDEIHPWVNYRQILQKCYIGELVQDLPKDITAPELVEEPEIPKTAFKFIPYAPKLNTSLKMNFDWIQKVETIYLYFYTGGYENPYVEIYPPREESVTMFITVASKRYTYKIHLKERVKWPASFKINYETGKLEVVFTKTTKGIWTTFGTLYMMVEDIENMIPSPEQYEVMGTRRVTHNCMFMEVKRKEGSLHNTPLGKHVKIWDSSNISRSYTPVPGCLRTNYKQENFTYKHLCFMFKRYPGGVVSKYVTDREPGNSMLISDPFGTFNLRMLSDSAYFVFLAAGSGITPILGLILFLIDRRIKPVDGVALLFFNRSEEDLIFKKELREFAENEKRFTLEWILSQPSDLWPGRRGHVNEDLIDEILSREETAMLDRKTDVFFGICGGSQFVEASEQALKALKIPENKSYVFPG